MRRDVLEEFVDASKLGRRRERLEGFTFIARGGDAVEDWRRSVHDFIGAIVTKRKKRKWWWRL